jgi:hypothetical protein
MRRTPLIACLLIVPGSLMAQGRWSLSFERGFTTFSEAAHDTNTPSVQVIPWHPASYTVRLARDGRRIGFAIGLTAANGQLGATIEDAAILPGGGLLLLEAAPELRFRIWASAVGATLAAHAGPVIDIWAPEGDDVRAAYGGMGGVTLTLPVTGRWSAAIRTDFAVTGSEATRDEESAEIRRAKTMRRGRLALGITRKL